MAGTETEGEVVVVTEDIAGEKDVAVGVGKVEKAVESEGKHVEEGTVLTKEALE